MRPAKAARLGFIYALLTVLSIVWLVPIFWLLLQSFRLSPTGNVNSFFPSNFTFRNYILLFTDPTAGGIFFFRTLVNTLFVAVLTCIMSTLFILSIAYVLSRFRFRLRKPYMKLALILGMFPGFLAIIAVFSMLGEIGLINGFWGLIGLSLVYSSAAGIGFFISKGYFDTVSKNLDEAARIDGASNARVFFRIILPLSKPIIVFTVLVAFIVPWSDFIFASFILRNAEWRTVPVGLFNLINEGTDAIDMFFTRFAAAAIIVAIPTSLLFLLMQRFYVAGITGGGVKG